MQEDVYEKKTLALSSKGYPGEGDVSVSTLRHGQNRCSKNMQQLPVKSVERQEME